MRGWGRDSPSILILASCIKRGNFRSSKKQACLFQVKRPPTTLVVGSGAKGGT